jgi:polyisoprenoid-binding protein YceI
MNNILVMPAEAGIQSERRLARYGFLLRWIPAFAGMTVFLLADTTHAGDVAAHWEVLPDKSSIEWTASYGGKPVTGSFPAYTADVAFDADHVDASRATIKIELAKVKSADHDAQENLPAPDWFSVARYPLATFDSTGFKHIRDDQYEAEGTLTVRDKTVKVTLPFTAKFSDDNTETSPAHYAHITGETTVKRTQLGVGQGDWTQTDTIADDVKITVHLEARQVP